MNKYIFFTTIALVFVSCGTSGFQKRKYKRGFQYGDRNSELSYQEIDAITEKTKKKNEIMELVVDTDSIESYTDFLFLETGVSEKKSPIYESDVYDKPVEIEQGSIERKENREIDLVKHQELPEKKGKRLMLIGGLWLLYIPIVGALAIIAIVTLNSSAMFVLANIFLLLLITLSIFMAWTKRHVKNTKRNKSRLIILILNIVVGISTFLFIAYHAIADSI